MPNFCNYNNNYNIIVVVVMISSFVKASLSLASRVKCFARYRDSNSKHIKINEIKEDQIKSKMMFFDGRGNQNTWEKTSQSRAENLHVMLGLLGIKPSALATAVRLHPSPTRRLELPRIHW